MEFRRPSRERFYEVDHLVTGMAFEVHNEFGRLFDEHVYQHELARRCNNAGLDALAEVRLAAVHESFRKEYFVDLVVDGGVVLEIKAKEALAPKDTAQTLHYLFMADLPHGALLNFRPARVAHEFVSTTLTTDQRRRYEVDDRQWAPQSAEVDGVKERLLALLDDWGTGLQLGLYRDALVHFAGGSETVERRIDVRDGGRQRVRLIDEDVCLSVTGTTNPEAFAGHLRRFLQHTSLRSIAWINLLRSKVTFTTLN